MNIYTIMAIDHLGQFLHEDYFDKATALKEYHELLDDPCIVLIELVDELGKLIASR